MGSKQSWIMETLALSALIRKYGDVLYYAANFSQHKISEESFERIL